MNQHNDAMGQAQSLSNAEVANLCDLTTNIRF